MQQRRLRLGDIVDDYCPRERRITNHAIVAIVEDEVKQTRCTTCDADHEYKQARVPSQRRKKDLPPGTPVEVGAVTRKRPAAEQAEAVDPAAEPEAPVADEPTPSQEPAEFADVSMAAAPADGPQEPQESYEDAADQERDERPDDDGPVHRRLIRATLPRPEGQQPERKLPEFTMHQREVNGNRAGRGHRRGPRQAQMRSHQGGGGQFSRPGGGGQRQGPRHGAAHGGGQGQQGQHGQHGQQGQPGNRPAQGPRRKRRR